MASRNTQKLPREAGKHCVYCGELLGFWGLAKKEAAMSDAQMDAEIERSHEFADEVMGRLFDEVPDDCDLPSVAYGLFRQLVDFLALAGWTAEELKADIDRDVAMADVEGEA